MNKSTLFCLLIAISLVACKKTPEKVLPNTPQEVTAAWWEHLNANHFDDAKELSDPDALEFVEYLERTYELDSEDSLSAKIVLKQLNCEEMNERAVCRFINEFEEPDSLDLVKIDGQWLVHIPPADDFIEQDSSDFPLDSLGF